MTKEKVLTIEGLCASAGGKQVLNGVDIEIRPSEVHAAVSYTHLTLPTIYSV